MESLMKKYKFLCDGWKDEEAFYVNNISLIDAVIVFEHIARSNSWDYRKFTVEIIEINTGNGLI